jgi:S-DNA-T family DNA segregation ATPase FtsK/SpoIIIE
MVDPKQLEFSLYEGIPHLLLPVVTDPKKAAAALRWAVVEMDRRYTLMREARVRQLRDYNRWVDTQRAAWAAEQSQRGISLHEDDEPFEDIEPPEKLPYVVVFIDEFAELMMVASKDVEVSVTRLAQKARASGIHLILATQRPSVDVITGVIKANFPARIGLQVAQREDSRTILGQNGAENLLGDGDMLVMSPGTSGLTRVHGPLVTDGEIQRVCDVWKAQGRPSYNMDILSDDEKAEESAESDDIKDEVYDQAVHIVAEARMASASMLQRRLRIGYNRAARLIEIMEREGVVGPPDGARPREVLVPPPIEM